MVKIANHQKNIRPYKQGSLDKREDFNADAS